MVSGEHYARYIWSTNDGNFKRIPGATAFSPAFVLWRGIEITRCVVSAFEKPGEPPACPILNRALLSRLANVGQRGETAHVQICGSGRVRLPFSPLFARAAIKVGDSGQRGGPWHICTFRPFNPSASLTGICEAVVNSCSACRRLRYLNFMQIWTVCRGLGRRYCYLIALTEVVVNTPMAVYATCSGCLASFI